jgi:hypothetical protein
LSVRDYKSKLAFPVEINKPFAKSTLLLLKDFVSCRLCIGWIAVLGWPGENVEEEQF